MRRAGTMTKGAALASLLLLVGAGPAGAHAAFEGEAVPPDTHQVLALHVAGERPDAHTVKVVVTLPAEFELHGCEVSPGWSCTATSAVGDHPGQVAYTLLEEDHAHAKSAAPAHADEPTPPPDGSAPEEEADMYHFSVHTASEPGSYSFPVEQEYSSGDKVSWDGEAGSKEPAPVLTVAEPAQQEPAQPDPAK
ncbi:MAG: DUF1775 domain-containing protein [Acidimicrobiia bacterium]